ncbi:MAG TPA: transglycosylase SLT domain-containing protein [Stellaceae bacterium]
MRLPTGALPRRAPVAARVARSRPAAHIVATKPRHPAKLACSLMLVLMGISIWASALYGADMLSFPRASTAAAEVAAPAAPPPDDGTPAPQPDTDVAAAYGMSENVWHAIEYATQAVGVDAVYLVAVAERESGFDPAIRAPTTSATGLYQFTEDTWLRVIKVFGSRHGLDAYARQIGIDEYGDVTVSRSARAKLLQLRNDPKLSALMAAELARDNKARLERVLGRDVTPAETYLAHFLGVSQAARIIAAAHSRPHVSGARLLPAAARSNPAVFSPAGRAASAGAIVGKIESYFDREVPRSARI